MYHSKTRQNKLIKICGNQTQEQIVAEINNRVAVLHIQFLDTSKGLWKY